MVSRLPQRFAKYFWDTDLQSVHVDENGDYVVKRLLDLGDTESIKWLIDYYGIEKIKKVLRLYRGIKRKTAFYWMNVLNLTKKEIKCLQTPYQATPFGA